MEPQDLVGRDDADVMVGGSIRYYVRSGRIAPWKTLPGRTGAHLFLRADVERLREELLADHLAAVERLNEAAAS
jgi:hypothetical protein